MKNHLEKKTIIDQSYLYFWAEVCIDLFLVQACLTFYLSYMLSLTAIMGCNFFVRKNAKQSSA